MIVKFNWRHIILAIIIAIFFLMFLVFGTKLIYPNPEYGNFCAEQITKILPENLSKEQAAEENQRFIECQERYDAALRNYSNNLFLFTIIFVVIIVALSLLLIKNEAVSGGLLLGSLFYLIYGTSAYWRFMNDIYRFIALGIGLLVLIYIGYRVSKK